MTPFLQQVASLFERTYAEELSEMLFVFPNRRAGVFFQRYLAKSANRPLLSPQIMTINDLFMWFSSAQLIDRTHQLFRLYEIYVRLSKSQESFDSFLYWGEMLLNDFDDIDKYLVDAQKLFSSVEDIKEIDQLFAFLDEQQVALIKRFWSNFIPATESERKQQFIKTWRLLYPLYQEFKTQLGAEGLAYEGMIFRQVCDTLGAQSDFELPAKKIVFVGLNAMTTSERVLLKLLQQRGVADFYWDYESPLLRDPDNMASFFYKDNVLQFPSFHKLEQVKALVMPEIHVIGVSSGVGQTRCAQQIIAELIDQGAIADCDHAINTAVVLPEEHMLMPMLYAVPEEISTINVTMGYALAHTPIAAFMDFLFALQLSVKWEEQEAYFYYQQVLSLLNHRYVRLFAEEQVQKLQQLIQLENRVYIRASEVRQMAPIFDLIFKPVSTSHQSVFYFKAILEQLQRAMPDAPEDTDQVTLSELEKEFIFHYYLTSNRLGDLLLDFEVESSLFTYFEILKKLVKGLSIPFRGEPLSGLQVMGVLETRGLDFENQIVLSMNEGVFPQKSVANSFIPHHLRKGHGLSTYEHQDAIFAYHFYRMISRAKRVYLVYDTRISGMQSGEVSRFVHQLKYHYGVALQEQNVLYDLKVPAQSSIRVRKTPEVLDKLSRYLKGGSRALSASALITYMSCPLKFYFQYIEDLQEEQDVDEQMQSRTFGTIYHAVMEELYKPFAQKELTKKDLEELGKQKDYIRSVVEKLYVQFFLYNKSSEHLQGYNSLMVDVFLSYIIQTLKVDALHAPFMHKQVELLLKGSLTLSSGIEVKLKGFVDRVDQKEGRIQIIDYKTGSGLLEFAGMDSLFDASLPTWNKALFQVFLYALLYTQGQEVSGVEPKVYYLRNLFKKERQVSAVYKTSTRIAPCHVELEEGDVRNCIRILPEYQERIEKLLENIFDEKIDFTQTEQEKVCEYCFMRTLCKK